MDENVVVLLPGILIPLKEALDKGLLEPPHSSNYGKISGKKRTPETIRKISEALTGRKLTIESPLLGKTWEEIHGMERAREMRNHLSKVNTGKKQTPMCCAKKSKITTKRYEDPKEREKQSRRLKELWKYPEHRVKVLDGYTSEVRENMSKTQTERWNDPDYQKMMKDARDSRPNHFEVDFWKHFPELTYTGDFSFFIGSKNPDFILKGTNKCIDTFGDRWHKESEVQKRIEYFSQRGKELLIVWESEWNKDKDETIQRVNEFFS